MRILAIECAHPPGSIALLDGPDLLEQAELDSPSKTTEQFACTIDSVLKRAECQPAGIDFVASHTGPGSFTGLRIGVTAAKTFAYAVGKKAVGINTLHTLAEQVRASMDVGNDQTITSVIDAQRGQLFSATFVVNGGQLSVSSQTLIVSRADWLSQLSRGTIATGFGLKKIKDELPVGCVCAPEDLWRPSAETLGRLAYQSVQMGAEVSPLELQPNYYRKSAAEEKADQQP